MIDAKQAVGLATILAFGIMLACGAGASGGDNGTPLPDGVVKSKTYKPSNRLFEVCVHPEGAPTRLVKCHDFPKDEVSGCDVGSYWPDCYHMPVKQGFKILRGRSDKWQHV